MDADDRPTRELIHMSTAGIWAKRSLCTRGQAGTVITTEDMRRVLSIGYNGPAKGLPHDRCNGEKGKCGCLHAEDNAIAALDSTITKKSLFTTMSPCVMCAQRIIQAGIGRVYFWEQYRTHEGLSVLASVGIECQSLKGMSYP
ncbi:hypothetical protein LCGC14_1827500 [marine sediment metagenome]|uniref:CMP/dCMP-type deaminase domain-containing protein n=1 Tax=marine sediment metagenome TaxID=412755 RepID=A0A0F9GHC6_9ZZZZ